jgi:hypothetical protein
LTISLHFGTGIPDWCPSESFLSVKRECANFPGESGLPSWTTMVRDHPPRMG